MKDFILKSPFPLSGDQPQAVKEIVDNFKKGAKRQTLLGVTGSGKTFTMANVIKELKIPTLIMSHNKTLAAQLYGELLQFFPDNAVEYFISYYDYYQPEAYVPQIDLYIEKDASINENIDKLRLRSTTSLMERNDVAVIGSVSVIYGLGSPDEYKNFITVIKKGDEIDRDLFLQKLIAIFYDRNDFSLERGTFRVKGDTVDIQLAYEDTTIRIVFFGDEVEEIQEINKLTGEIIKNRDSVGIYPAKHFITSPEKLERAIENIRKDLKIRLNELHKENKLVEAQRLESRVNYDIEMLLNIGTCSGVENYSRYLSNRPEGSRPFCLIDFFPNEFLLIIDESHVSIPQIRGMYAGDYSRKKNLVDFGFRLPAALDNRPLKFEEFNNLIDKVLYVSATPGEYEIEDSQGIVVEQIIRPTGLVDPKMLIRPASTQVDDLVGEIRKRIEKKEKVLVTTLTKKMSEDLTTYLEDLGIKVKYLHSEINALDRISIIRDLRLDKFDVLVGVNLLREGLDLPEVSLVAILDADKEGFLRDERSIIQTAGRAARNVNGEVILYADKETKSIRNAISETERRRKKQLAYNEEHNIVPKSILKRVEDIMLSTSAADYNKRKEDKKPEDIKKPEGKTDQELVEFLEQQMLQASEELDFELAIILRDEIERIKNKIAVEEMDPRRKI